VSTPRFRADHVGSLKRPEALQKAREELLGPHDAVRNLGAHDNEELKRLEDRYIRDVVGLQETIGLQSITDGEFRRRTWWTDFVLNLEGISVTMAGASGLSGVDHEGRRRPLPGVTVHDKIRWRRSATVDAFTFLRSVTRRTPKVMMPAPPIVHYFSGREGIAKTAYPDLAAFWDDLVGAYRMEFQALGDAGCTYVQMDECMIAFLCDPKHREWLHSRGQDPDRLLGTYADAINRVIGGRPPGMTVAMHLCRGNMSGHWFAEGGYEPVADTLFNGIDVDAYFLEYDSPRAGTFEPLRLVPKHKALVLGLVSTKTPTLESADDLKRRIGEASRYVALDQLCLSPQCGFSSNYIGNPVTIDDQKRKLGLVVDVARGVWG